MAAVSFQSAGTGTGVLPRVDGNTVSRTAGRGFRPQAALAASLPVRAGKPSEMHPTAAAQSFAPARTAFPSTSSGHHPADGCAPPCDTPPPRDGAAFCALGLVGKARSGPHPPRQPRSPWKAFAPWLVIFPRAPWQQPAGFALSLPAGARSSAQGKPPCMHSDNCLTPIASEHPAGGPSRHR